MHVSGQASAACPSPPLVQGPTSTTNAEAAWRSIEASANCQKPNAGFGDDNFLSTASDPRHENARKKKSSSTWTHSNASKSGHTALQESQHAGDLGMLGKKKHSEISPSRLAREDREGIIQHYLHTWQWKIKLTRALVKAAGYTYGILRIKLIKHYHHWHHADFDWHPSMECLHSTSKFSGGRCGVVFWSPFLQHDPVISCHCHVTYCCGSTRSYHGEHWNSLQMDVHDKKRHHWVSPTPIYISSIHTYVRMIPEPLSIGECHESFTLVTFWMWSWEEREHSIWNKWNKSCPSLSQMFGQAAPSCNAAMRHHKKVDTKQPHCAAG